MQPVLLACLIDWTSGTWGFSCLVLPVFGEVPERKTVLFVRDDKGTVQHSLILKAEEVS